MSVYPTGLTCPKMNGLKRYLYKKASVKEADLEIVMPCAELNVVFDSFSDFVPLLPPKFRFNLAVPSPPKPKASTVSTPSTERSLSSENSVSSTQRSAR